MYDVIVVGAGPCGSTAASVLAKSGLNVLLLEKYKLPRYKSCSGILIEKSLRLVKEIFGCDIPDAVTCTPAQNRGMVFTDDTGREYKFESRGFNVWRDKFDGWLTELAREAGVTVRDGSAVSSMEEHESGVCVTVNGKCEYAKFAVDCSGVVGIGTKKHESVITYQTYNKGVIGLDAHYFYAFLQPQLSGYDAWFNVKDGMLVLGVASKDASELPACYEAFTAYMKERHGLQIHKQLKTDKWLIRSIAPPFVIDYGSARILKAGECAGLLNPMGEGISSAIESGNLAARAIIADLSHRQNAIAAYRESLRETESYMRRQWQLVARMSQKFAYMNR